MSRSSDTAPKNGQPYALFIRGTHAQCLDLSDTLGFESPMEALAVSVFEDGPQTMHVEALYQTQSQAQGALDVLSLPASMESFITQLPDEDWVSLSQSGLPPVDAGRFWIHGDHDADKVPSHIPYPIRINAGMAFGTGHHGTTRGCLMIFDALLQEGFAPKTVLDLGCGAGILGIGAAMALKLPILATDIDPDAVHVTVENAKFNGVGAMISAHISDGFDDAVLKGKTFELIFANILAGPLIGLAPDIARALSPEGKVILSGILDEQASAVAQAFAKAGIKTYPHLSLAGWTSLVGTLA